MALISGGLDSQLAARVIQLQGIEVEALHFTSLFCPSQAGPAELAARLGVRLTVCALQEDYLDTVRNPRFGYGRAANPCLDCRIFMFRRALEFMPQLGAEFVVSGEIAGQQAMSQRRRDLEAIAHHSGLRDRLLRPLSAKILAATLPELAGWVDRERLYGFFGRGRRGLLQLARDLGIDEIPAPSSGCALSEPQFSRKFFDLLRHAPTRGLWGFELLKYGRHFRFDERCKVVVGRNEAENRQLAELYERRGDETVALLTPVGFVGPVALAAGASAQESLQFACGLVRRFSKQAIPAGGHVRVLLGNEVRSLDLAAHPAADSAQTVG
ncbi:MAG: hypothetical protein ACYC3X_07205 [Pirellulaceae bacterium]